MRDLARWLKHTRTSGAVIGGAASILGIVRWIGEFAAALEMPEIRSDLQAILERRPAHVYLYELRLWAPGETPELLRGYLDNRAANGPSRRWFLQSKRHSLREINEADDPRQRERWRMSIRRDLLREQVLSGSGKGTKRTAPGSWRCPSTTAACG